MNEFINNNLALISIIMPVYNAEQYLRRAINSIIAQTMTEWELLLIDDGSNDSSPSICNEYASRDRRIKVIHKQNAGVSAARQDGLDAAVGEYVIHTDSDDWVEPDMLEELYKKAMEDEADVVICDFYDDNDGAVTLRKQQPTSLLPCQVLRELFQQLHGSCCNKLARRVCYNKYGIRFPNGINLCEDLLTWVQLFQHDIKISYLSKAFYHYCVNVESITHIYDRSRYELGQKLITLYEHYLPKSGFEDVLDKTKLDCFTEAVMYNLITTEELQRGVKVYRSLAYKIYSGRWKLGYICLDLHLYRLARYFIRY